MPHDLIFKNTKVQSQAGETVLTTLIRTGLNPDYSCKSGSCQTCMLQAETGEIPEKAQRTLPKHLQRLRYFLPCRCTPQSAMQLRTPNPNDLIHTCELCEAEVQEGGRIKLTFQSARPLQYRTGQHLRIVVMTEGSEDEPLLTLTSDPKRDLLITAQLENSNPTASQKSSLPPELQAQCGDAAFGFTFEVRGPFDDQPPHELPYPEVDVDADEDLWNAFGGDTQVRSVMDAFYTKVYADPLLAPFFVKVTKERAADKQFSFLKQCVTGEKIYMGDRPRNAHHWMIITHELFDHRQSLMLQTLQEHAMSEALIARWTAYEEYFRPDIVKSTRQPRYLGNIAIASEGVTRELLGEGSLCDECQGEVRAGETVLLHHHLGTISCARCADTQV